MKKPKTVTISRLQKLLTQLIYEGNGATPVCIDKDTFSHNLEGDGCVVLPVSGVRIEHVLQIDDDGGVKTTKRGQECTRKTAVVFGGSGEAFISEDATALAFLKRAGEAGRIVSSGNLTLLQIAAAQAEGRFYVDPSGFGWALLPWDLTTDNDQRRSGLAPPSVSGEVGVVKCINTPPSQSSTAIRSGQL